MNGKSIVFDSGTCECKAGFVADTSPLCFPSVVGRRYNEGVASCYVGVGAIDRRDELDLNYPIERGVVTDWNDMESIWNHVFNELSSNVLEESPVLLTDPCLNPFRKDTRTKMKEIMFEVFAVPAVYFSNEAVLSLYALGKTTGMVLAIGDGVTHAVPIYDGFLLSPAVYRQDFAGIDLTRHLTTLLSQKGLNDKAAQREVVNDIKEKLCYVAYEYDDEMTQFELLPGTLEKSYELPDGNVITLGSERIQCPEILFNPLLMGETEMMGLHELLFSSINKSDIDLRKDLYYNIALSGGTSMCRGLVDRLTRELVSMAPTSMRVKVHAPPDRKYSAWRGGTILASLEVFQQLWESKEEYEESGPQIIIRRPW